MSDGKWLKAYVLQPSQKIPRPWPTIFVYTNYGAKVFRDAVLQKSDVDDPLFGPGGKAIFAFVFVDRRGRRESVSAWYEGCPTTGEDGADVCAWIAKREFCDGNIGMFGRSADGINQYLTAVQHPPALKAITPSVARLTDKYSHYYPGGVLEEAYLSLVDGEYGGRWDSVTAHPQLDSWWSGRIAGQRIPPEEIGLPTLLQTGWWDHNVDFSFEDYDALRGRSAKGRYTKLVVGPWSHMTSGWLKQGQLEFPKAKQKDKFYFRQFFDFWLRGIANGFYDEEPIYYYQTGREEWINASAWPPDTTDETYFLRAEAHLSRTPPGGGGAHEYEFDPRDPSPSLGGPMAGPSSRFRDLVIGPAYQDEHVLSGRDDYALYDTPPLESDLDVIGSPHLKVYIQCDRPDTDISFRLCDYDPDAPEGRRTLLLMTGVRRMRYRSSWTSPTPMNPDDIYEVTIECDRIAHTWKRRHKVRLIVSSSNYPLYSVNPNSGADFVWEEGEELVATVRIHHDRAHPSGLVLPVVD
jgi:putative CocE/NonD family hydrolase